MKLSLIVAMAANRVIGKDNQMPWHLPGDLPRFKRITMGKPIIMGRKTHESIGRVLPGRPNVVLSRSVKQLPGVAVYANLDDAIAALESNYDEAFIIGGGEIYRQALPRCDRLYLTRIHDNVEGDTLFPVFDASDFIEVEREDVDEPIPHSYVTLERRAD